MEPEELPLEEAAARFLVVSCAGLECHWDGLLTTTIMDRTQGWSTLDYNEAA